MTQFGQNIKLIRRDSMPDLALDFHKQMIEYFTQQDYVSVLLPDIKATNDLKRSLGDDYKKYVLPLLLTVQATVFFIERDYKSSSKKLNKALLAEEEVWGKEHPIIGTTLNNLAVVYKSEGKHEEVKKLANRTLKIYDRSTRHDHLICIQTLNELGLYFNKQEKSEEEERCCKRAFEICEPHMSSGDPIAAVTLRKLAVCYVKQNKYKDAEELFKRVLTRAYKKNLSDTNNKSTFLQMLTTKGVFGISKNSSSKCVNIWQVAEERQKNKEKFSNEVCPPVWKKPADFDSPSCKIALNGLEVLYEMSGQRVAAKTLRYFANQQVTEMSEISSISSPISTPPPLPPKVRSTLISLPLPSSANRSESSLGTVPRATIPAPPPLPSPPSSPIMPTRGYGPFRWNLSPTRTQTPAPPPLPSRESSLGTVPRAILPSAAAAAVPEEILSLKQIIEDLQAQNDEKDQKIVKIELTIENFDCKICKINVANTIWSPCNHLVSCPECADTLMVTAAEENRSEHGVACPICRAHGHPSVVYI